MHPHGHQADERSGRLSLLYESPGEVIDGVKTQPYSERSLVVLPPNLLERAIKPNRWFCFPPMHPHFVVAMKPSMIP